MAISLYNDKSACCGCGVCRDACPHGAIKMEPDEYGFLYPKADPKLCVECGLCLGVCPLRSEAAAVMPKRAWAATSVSHDKLDTCSSGGVAATLSEYAAAQGGVVYGVAMEQTELGLAPRHIRLDGGERLESLRGSKYAQSDTEGVYAQLKRDIDGARQVLFTGTPCQCAAARRFAGDAENLITLDLVCHGVPSQQMMRGFIDFVEKKYGARAIGVNFRGKSKGQGVMVAFTLEKPDGGTKTVVLNGRTEPYFAGFLNCLLSRESCYACPFARLERASDLTVGDFWGFHEEYPEAEKLFGLTNAEGVSCVLASTDKGAALFEACADSFKSMPASPEKAARHNDQLRAPSAPGRGRSELRKAYLDGGYAGFDRLYRRLYRSDRFKETLVALVPKSTRREIMKLRGRLKG